MNAIPLIGDNVADYRAALPAGGALLGLDLAPKRLIQPSGGKRLWETLCDAFELPAWLKDRIPVRGE